MAVYALQYVKWLKYVLRTIIYKLNSIFQHKVIRPALYMRTFNILNINLDIGCGTQGIGTVNLDLFIERTKHRSYEIETEKLRNFIIADAQHLPLRAKVFKATHASHILEHLLDPIKGLKEMSRVSQSTSIICVPTPLNELDQTEGHLYTWNKFTFTNILAQAFPIKRVIQTPYELIGICQQSIPTRIKEET